MKTIFLFFIYLLSISCFSLSIFAQITPGHSDNFITVWNPNSDDYITIAGNENWSYNYNLYWEKVDDPTVNGTQLNIISTTFVLSDLDSDTEYRIEINGLFPIIHMGALLWSSTEVSKLYEVKQWGSNQWNSFEGAFMGCTNLDVTATDTPDLTNVKSMAFMFGRCSSLSGYNANWNWNTSTVLDMSGLFYLTYGAFNQDISSWDVSNVTTMADMFFFAMGFNQDIGNWNVENVTDMNGMFMYATGFNKDIGSWNVSSVTDMSNMFDNATSFNQDIGSWDVSKVTNISSMFREMFFNKDISNWDLSDVTNTNAMFKGNIAFNQDISKWNVSAVTNMSYMFDNATSFNQDIGSWDVRNVTTMAYMFNNATSFNQNLENWNIMSLTMGIGFFINSGIDCVNYSYTLIGWANNPDTPTEQYFIIPWNVTSTGMKYSSDAITARNFLIDTKSWIIQGDELIENTPLPYSGIINGQDIVCLGYGEKLQIDAMGGTWSSADTLIASIDEYGQIITYKGGTTNISYSVNSSNACSGTARSYLLFTVVELNAGNIFGETTLCIDSIITLTSDTPGGTWTTKNSFATIDQQGNVVGMNVGEETVIRWIIDSYSCSDSTEFKINIVDCSQTSEPPENLSLSDKQQFEVVIYPNPVTNILYIESSIFNAEVEIYDTQGKNIEKQILYNEKTYFNIENWKSGVYMIKIIAENDVWTERIVKK